MSNSGFASTHHLADLVSYPNNQFASTYLEPSNNRLVVQQIKNGQVIPGYTTQDVSHSNGETGNIHHLASCSYNEQLLVMYDYVYPSSTNRWDVHGRVVHQNGTFKTNQFELPGSNTMNGTLNTCVQSDTNEVLVLSSIQNPTNSWDVWVQYYYPENNTFSASNIINSENLVGRQAYQYQVKLPGAGKEFVIAFSGRSTNPTMPGEGIHIYKLNSTLQSTQTRVEIPGTGNTASTYDRYIRMVTLTNGNILIVYETRISSTSSVSYSVYDDSLNEICVKTTLYNNADFPDVSLYNDIAYIAFFSTAPTAQVIGLTLNPATCTLQDTYTIHSGPVIANSVSIGTSVDTDTVESAIILVQFVTNATPRQLILYEYLIEQVDSSGSLNQCSDQRCLGCYGSYTCPICDGSDDIQKLIRKDGPNTCTCQDTYYDTFPTDQDCQACVFPCANCLSPTQCETCQTVDPNQSAPPNCLCNSGYSRLNTDTMCSQCNYKCDTCVGTIAVCDSCADSNRSMPNCDCDPGFWDDGSKICVACTYPCEHCSDASTCTSCQNPANRVSMTDCTCVQGTFDNNTLCQDCHISCLDCSGTHTNCGTFCDYKCNGCSGTASTCDSCSHSTRVSPNCECGPGFYDDGINPACIPCPYPCDTCVKETCLSCLGNFRFLPDCLCQQGYFEVTGQDDCQQCNLQCLQCEGSADNCTQCAPGIGRDDSTCKCGEGFFEQKNSTDCLICNPNCRNCEGSPENCTECLNPNLLYPFCNQYKKDGYYLEKGDSDQLEPLQCDTKCLQCKSSPSNCLKCIASAFRNNNTPYCSCMDGYHDNNGQTEDCIQCPIGCLRCQSDNICHECDTSKNLKLDELSKTCVCKKNYKFNESTQQCQQCYLYQNECLFQCPPNTSPSETQQICMQKLNDIQQNMFLYYIGLILILVSMVFAIMFLFKQSIKKSTIDQKITQQRKEEIIDIDIET